MKNIMDVKILAHSFFIAVLLGVSSAHALYVKAETTYDNGAYSSTIFDTLIINQQGVERLNSAGETPGPWYLYPDSFVSGIYISQSGFTYSFGSEALSGMNDMLVDVPLSDLDSGNIHSGIVFYHYYFKEDYFSGACNNSSFFLQCMEEAPSEFSEYAIMSYDLNGQRQFDSINTGIYLTTSEVPVPASLGFFAFSLLGLFSRSLRRTFHSIVYK